jgi:predicted dienelactone hydrolase
MNSTPTIAIFLLRRLAMVALSATLLAHWPAGAQQSVPGRAADAGAGPQAAGENAEIVGLDLDWEDAARKRAVPVRLYLPEGASAARPVPLVVFSHGMGGSRRGYSYLGRYWASQGYASLHLQHVGSDRSVWTGNIFSTVGRLQGAAQDEEAIARVGDFRFALDQLLAHPELGPRVDANRIVAAGHSYGANTSMLAVGARVQRNGRVIDLADPRVKAAILLSAPPFYGEPDTAKILAGIKVPTLHITATEDVIRVPGFYSGAEDRITVFDATPGPRKFLAVFEGGSHSIFTDRGGTGGATLNPQVKAATRELGLAFMKSVFEREDAALIAWPKRFAALLARFTAGEH